MIYSSIEAIIVPTVSDKNPAYAIDLAKKTGSLLCVLCSGAADESALGERIDSAGVRGAAVTITSDYAALQLGFRTTDCAAARYGREANDLALKRNIGLLIARMIRWNRVLFLDDDIDEIVERADLQASDVTVGGFLVQDFPDNSVVRHAERLSGFEPGVSVVSGGALLVSPQSAAAFFPDIYNEDWFFMYGQQLAGRHYEVIGNARQQPHKPFASPARAVAEEFGDVVAEGLMQLRWRGVAAGDATLADWRAVIANRQQQLNDIDERLSYQTQSRNVYAARQSVAAGTTRLAEITADACAAYVVAWLSDLELWQARVRDLPGCNTVEDALDVLKSMMIAV